MSPHPALLLQDKHPEQGAQSFPVITACLFGESGEITIFQKNILL